MTRALVGLWLVAAVTGCATGPRVTAPPPSPQDVQESRTPGPQPWPTASPTPTPAPPVAGPVPTPLPAAEAAVEVRILLERARDAVTLPQPGRAWRVAADGAERWLWGPLTLEVAAGARWWQVGAFTEPDAALAAEARLRAALGTGADVATSTAPDEGLSRVRAAWREAEPDDPSASLEAAGFPGAFAAPGPGLARVTDRAGTVVEAGEIRLAPGDAWPAAIGGARYHGRFRARVSGGDLLVINHLDMETYLKGVVPVEMGPAAFPQLAALKAQTVAARTYAAAHLGDHDDEGYDLCDTPACQVYRGAGVHHPLTDRAVEETAGLILTYAGEPVDAMFSSTCGGHTEDAAELFPPRAQPYLTGVPCAWERELRLEGTGFAGEWTDRTGQSAAVARGLLELPPDGDEIAVLAGVGRLLSVIPPRPAKDDLESLVGALLETTGLASTGRILTPETGSVDRLLFLADLYLVPLDPPSGDDREWFAAAALAALELRGEVVRDTGELVPRPGGAVGIFPRRAKAGEDLAQPAPLWERWQGGFRRRTAMAVRPGVELERLRRGDRVLAVVARRSSGDGEADRRSAWREWVREKPWSELATMLGIPDLVSLEVTRRSNSGRVVGLAAEGRSGTRREWTGFDVRRALGLPETLFSMQVVDRPGEPRVVRFLGRGWGHGVGLCQNGAYGLARSGMTFDRILAHYYRGAVLTPIR